MLWIQGKLQVMKTEAITDFKDRNKQTYIAGLTLSTYVGALFLALFGMVLIFSYN
jgi:hypothetical protein